jgi:hypothetical protein
VREGVVPSLTGVLGLSGEQTGTTVLHRASWMRPQGSRARHHQESTPAVIMWARGQRT